MLKNFFGLLIFIVMSSAVFADWDQAYFRGTPNNWGVTSMEKAGHGTWKIVVRFEGGDSNGGPRFKISRYNNWDQAYPDKDYKVDGNSSYEITFKERSKEIFVKKIERHGHDDEYDDGDSHKHKHHGDYDDDSDKIWEQAYFRGTPNGWGSSKMEKVGKHLWMIRVRFRDGEDGTPRFKISRRKDWKEAYPNSDYTVRPGVYEIYFNDRTKEIRVERIKKIRKDMYIIEKIKEKDEETNSDSGSPKKIIELKAELN